MQTITYIPEFDVVLSRRCAYSCGYCDFTNTPSPPPPSLRVIKRHVRTAARLGAIQITLTAGEGIEDFVEIASTARYYGFNTWWDYIDEASRTILSMKLRLPMFPVLEVGEIPLSELTKFRKSASAVRLSLDSVDDVLTRRGPLRIAPQKKLQRRMEALELLGKLRIPTITGILVGIGESQQSWDEAARIVSQLQGRFGHIQRFVLTPFRPVKFSEMANYPPVTDDVLLQATSIVRKALSPSVELSVEVQDRMHLVKALVARGVTDIGPIRYGNSDRFNIDAPARVDEHKQTLRDHGIVLKERTPLREPFDGDFEIAPGIKKSVQLFHECLARPSTRDNAAFDCA